MGPFARFLNWSTIPFSFIVFFWALSLSIAAVVCGSIDLKRIKKGLYSNKRKRLYTALDITGIVLGSVAIILVLIIAIGGILETLANSGSINWS